MWKDNTLDDISTSTSVLFCRCKKTGQRLVRRIGLTMDSSQSPLTQSEFDGYYAQIQASALKATKHAAALPTDLAFHRSVDSDLASDLEACSNKVMSITNMLLNLASTVGSSSKSAKGKGKARVRDEDDFIDRFGSLIVEPMDQLFERAVCSILHPCVFLLPYAGYRT
jgi:hypothetical protein